MKRYYHQNHGRKDLDRYGDDELMKLLNAATRLTSVTFVSLMFNLIFITSVVATSYYVSNKGDLPSYVINGVFNCQVFINAICVTLYFNFGKRLYGYLCCICHQSFQAFLNRYAIIS